MVVVTWFSVEDQTEVQFAVCVDVEAGGESLSASKCFMITATDNPNSNATDNLKRS
jgi:hypothetical protein